MTNRRLAALVFFACAIPRAAMLLAVPRPPDNYYWDLATALLAGHGYSRLGMPTTAIEPLYPAFLAAARWISRDDFTAVMSIQVVAAAIAGVMLFHMTLRLTGTVRAGLVASLLYAFYPYYVRQSVAPLEVTASVVLLIGAASRFARIEDTKGAAACGVWLGLLVLLRVMFAPIWIAASAILALSERRRGAAVVLLIPILMVAPWVWRSRAVDRAAVPSRVGENLYLSWCEPASQAVPRYDVDLLVPQAYLAIDADRIVSTVPDEEAERAVDDALLARAVGCLREQPSGVLRKRLVNLAYVFSPVLLPVHARVPRPHPVIADGRVTFSGLRERPPAERASHFAAHLGITVLAVAGLWRRRRQLRSDALLLVMLANTAIVYAVFFPTTRLVAPTAFVLMFYAGSLAARSAPRA